MRKSLGIILSWMLLLAACVGENDIPSNLVGQQETTDNAAADSMGRFELTLTGERATRATTTVISKEEAELFLVTLYKGSDIVRTTTYLKDINTSLSAGYGYRVFAESVSEQTAITSNDGWGQRRYAGTSASFAIKAGEVTPVNVGCSVANAGFEVIFDESVSEYFTTSYSVTITDGERTLVFDAASGGSKVDGNITPGRIAYFNLDAEGSHTISYTIRAVGPKTVEKSGTIDLSKAVISRINLNYERSTFDFQVTLDEEYLFVEDIINITDEDIQVEDGSTDIIATHQPYTAEANTIATRTALDEEGNTVGWNADDAIAVYDFTSAKHSFPIAIGTDGQIKFSGKVTPKSPRFAAIYPHSLAAESAASSAALSATLPTTQYAATSTFAPELNISVAKGERHLDGSPTEVTFYNVCQLLRFSVPPYAAGKISSIRLTATAPIAGKLTIDYSAAAPKVSIAATESKVITILPPRRSTTFDAGTYYIVCAPSQLAGFTLSFTTASKGYSLASTTTFGGVLSRIHSLGNIDLISTPVPVATHVYSSDGLLQGTQVRITDAPIDGQAWSATIRNAAGTVVRTLAGSGDLQSAETDAAWPYLPKGTYTVSYTYTSSNNDARTGEVSLTVPAPTLRLIVDGYSAHTKYESGDTDGANACERLTFYAPSARFSVAESLLSNASYSHSYVRSFNGQSLTTTEAKNAVAWGNYTGVPVNASPYPFSVTAHFAGESVTATKDIRITGLPASFAPPTQAAGWGNDDGTTEFESNYVRLGNYSFSQPHRIKNDSWFRIPAGVKLTLDYDIILHRAAVNTTANVKAGNQEIVTVTESRYGQDVQNAGTKTITTNAAVTTVTCEGSYGSGATHTKVYKLNFKYGK